jgi:hypothetical protein
MGRWFWPLIALGSVIEALGAASFALALANRSDDEPTAGWTNYGPLVKGGDHDPLPWLVAGVILVVFGVVPYVVAARRR